MMNRYSPTIAVRGLKTCLVAGLVLCGAVGCESGTKPPAATPTAGATTPTTPAPSSFPPTTPAETAAASEAKPADAAGTSAGATASNITPSAPGDKTTAPPKLIVEGGETYDFGATEVGQEFEHVFLIKNDGTTDVPMKAGKPSCATCTSFSLDKELLKPGETAKATVKWHIKVENPEFRQYAPIMLDGNNQLKLYVVGKVQKRIIVSPDRWNLGSISDGAPKEFNATITSGILDKFDITSVTNSNPKLKITATPFTAEKLAEAKVKSGYDLKIALDPDITIGDFTDRAQINVEGLTSPIVVDVSALRAGPLQIIGIGWNPDTMSLGMGDFDPTKDYQTKLNVFTRGVDGELKIEKLECKDPRFSVELKPDEKFKGQAGDHRRYQLFVKVKASKEAVVYTPMDPLLLKLTTNQEKAKHIELKIKSSGLLR